MRKLKSLYLFCLHIINIILFEAIKALDKITASNIQDKPQGECDHDIVGGVVEVLVLGHAEQDQQVDLSSIYTCICFKSTNIVSVGNC